MKIRQIFAGIAALVAVLATPQVVAAQFYGGLMGSAVSAYNQVDFFYGCRGLCTIGGFETYEQNMHQVGYGGGAVLGVWMPINSTYAYGFDIDGVGNSGKGSIELFNDLVPPGNSNIFTQFAMRYNVNLVASILAHITKHADVYAKLGVSFTNIRYRLRVSWAGIGGTPFSDITSSEDKNFWGWVVGVGLSRTICHHFSAFVEYNFMSYGSHSLGFIDTPDNVANSASFGRLHRNYQNLFANMLKVGVTYNFAAI